MPQPNPSWLLSANTAAALTAGRRAVEDTSPRRIQGNSRHEPSSLRPLTCGLAAGGMTHKRSKGRFVPIRKSCSTNQNVV
jgi:hypothetical protein